MKGMAGVHEAFTSRCAIAAPCCHETGRRAYPLPVPVHLLPRGGKLPVYRIWYPVTLSPPPALPQLCGPLLNDVLACQV